MTGGQLIRNFSYKRLLISITTYLCNLNIAASKWCTITTFNKLALINKQTDEYVFTCVTNTDE